MRVLIEHDITSEIPHVNLGAPKLYSLI